MNCPTGSACRLELSCDAFSLCMRGGASRTLCSQAEPGNKDSELAVLGKVAAVARQNRFFIRRHDIHLATDLLTLAGF